MPKPLPLTERSFRSRPPNWCPGCGDFGIWTALKRALVTLQLKPDQLTIVFGIGCSGNMVNVVRAYGFHGLHGRTLPVAEGIRLANHKLPVIVVGGDGDGLGEGIGHFIHAIRANPNVTYILHDNQVYGLTKGEHSPTAPKGFVSTTAPTGVIEEPVNPIGLALAAGASFVSRGFAGDLDSLETLLVAAIRHQGLALVDVLQPCVTFNHHNTYLWYYQRVYQLSNVQHDPSKLDLAWRRAQEPMDEKIPVGIFFQTKRPTLESQLPPLQGGRTLLEQQPVRPVDISAVVAQYQ
ncbi:MAG: 2-oxoacid:ferredoxin oxidoreductase subunit beta [Candidatus Kerfeldbacteria bacterium]|nr:2-oxoacid:ferredoxin oxidoreductase subunit beta [Candidatus Kerfeldbacteria bacterium]